MAQQRSVERIYSWLGPVYNFIYGKLSFGEGREKIMEFLDPQEGERILEVGVGTGLSLPLYPQGCEVVGIDLSQSMLNEAQKLKKRHGLDNVELEQMDASQLRFDDDSFDKVAGSLFISATDEPEKALEEMKRVCKADGRVVLMNHFKADRPLVARMEELFDPFAKSIGFTSTLELQPLLDRVGGLEVQKMEKVNFFDLWTAVTLINRK